MARNALLGRPFRVLVVDDDEYYRVILQSYCHKLGYEVVFAEDGEEGIDRFSDVAPDIVLMDVMMPRMDGLEAARIIKSRQAQWVPIIFLTVMSGEPDLVAALEHGGDDFLTKPISFGLFRAKMLSLQRVLLLNHQVNTQAQRLRAYHDANEDELRTAKGLIDRVVYSQMREDEKFSYWMMPAKLLSGDVIAAARTPNGVLHVLLADGVGHGLSAAINVMPITPVFYKMTSRGHSLAEILREMNQTIRNVLPIDRFISAILFSVDFENARLQYWNGGIPAAWVINRHGVTVCQCESRNFPLGLKEVASYEGEVESLSWSEDLRVVMYSDGLIEAANREGAFFGGDQLLSSVVDSPVGDELASVQRAVFAHMAGMPHADDISFAVVRLDAMNALPRAMASALEESTNWVGDGWRFEMTYGPQELRTCDPVPIIVAVLDQFRIPKTWRGKLFMVLSELICNALEHGVLGLSSSMKDAADGDAYFEERVRRLKRLIVGEIRVALDICEDEGERCMRVRVSDSGQGFEVTALPPDEVALNLHGRYGRGIPLVRRMVKRLTYFGAGNVVEALLAM